MKNKDSLPSAELESRDGAKRRKSIKDSPYNELEKVLMEWFEGMHSANSSVSRTLNREEAARVASSGWLCRNSFFQCLFHMSLP
jgi:hypothetical protein